MEKYKKIISLSLCLGLLFSGIPHVFAEKDDVLNRGTVVKMLLNAADYYNSEVKKEDIIKGYGDGDLREEQNVTRVEALVMLKRAFGNLPQPQGYYNLIALKAGDFTDIPSWAAAELKNVFDSGIVEGDGTGLFMPDNPVTEGQLQLLIDRTYAAFASNIKDDFYATVNKDILDNMEIRPGMSKNSTLYELNDATTNQIIELIEDTVSSKYKHGTPEQKIADMYNCILDREARNKEGIAPIRKYLDMADKAQSLKDIEELEKVLYKDLKYLIFAGFLLTTDLKDSNKHMLGFSVYAPALAKTSYTDEAHKTAYIKYLKTLLLLSGESENDAERKAELCFEFEKEIAGAMLDSEEYSDVDKVYNVFTLDETDKKVKNIDVKALLNNQGFKPEEKIVIDDVGQVEKFSGLFVPDNLETLKAVAKLDILRSFGAMLNDDFEKASEALDSEMFGISGTLTDEEKATAAIEGIFPLYIGKIYSEKYFDEESKKDVEKMVRDIIGVYRERINNLTWMSDETKTKAIEKLDSMKLKVGYPDKWETYLDNVDILSVADGGSYFDNIAKISNAEMEYTISLQGKDIDKTLWGMQPYEVNACYEITNNDIILPAAILQSPIYDKNASYEENLGGIGYCIAHEITHAFDNNGAKFDKYGNASNWWSEEDYSKFEELCNSVVDFYDKQEAVPGIGANGKLTLSENVADLGAVSCVTEIASSLENPDYETLFKSMAYTWAFVSTREAADYANNTDVHSHQKLRVNRTIVNVDEFYKAFDIKEGDGMYVAPENRIEIW